MTAMRPQPRPGVLDIEAYVPGKSSAPGVAKVFKLSSNETPLGPSPQRDRGLSRPSPLIWRIIRTARPASLREAIGRAFGLDPDRIVCGAGSDDLLHLLAHAYLVDGDEAIHTTHGFLIYPIVTLGTGAKPVVAPEKDFTADVDAILAAVTKKTKIVFLANPNNPTGTCLSFDEVKRLHRGLPPHVLLVLDAAYAEYVRRNDYEAGIELVATSENVVMCRTFSKIHGLAALAARLDVRSRAISSMPSTAFAGRSTSPRPAIAAGIAAIEDVEHQERSREHNTRWLDWLTQEIGKLGLKVTPSVANFVLIHFPETKGRTAKDADAFLTARGLILRQTTAYKLPNALRMTRRHRRGQPARRRRTQRISGQSRRDAVTQARTAVQPPGVDRRRPDRLVDRAGGARAGRRARDRGDARAPRRRAGASPSSASPIRSSRPMPPRSPAPISSSSACRSAPAARSPRRSAPHLKPGAIGFRCRLGQGRDRARHGAALAGRRAFRAGASGRRHRTFRPRCRLCRVVRRPLVHPHAARRRRSGRRREARGVLARARRQRRNDAGRASRPGAGDHQPPAASDRLHDRRHRRRACRGDAFRSAQILRRRLSRLHPHRRVRSDHVARRVPGQQGRGAGNARHLQRGSCAIDRARSAAATATRLFEHFTRTPRDPPRHRRRSGRIRRRPISAGRIPTCRPSRCRGPTPFGRRAEARFSAP